MTNNQATYAAMLALDEASSRRVDRVRARVGGSQLLTNAQNLCVNSENNQHANSKHRGLYLLADTRGSGPRGPHPGDVLYWAACLGGACLLLLSATT